MSSTLTGSAVEPTDAAVVDVADPPDGSARLTIDTSVYRLSAVHKTSYRLAKQLTVVLGALDGTRLEATLLLPGGARGDARALTELFYRELTDQELRESIGEQTKDVRALLLAHAFSRTDLVKRE